MIFATKDNCVGKVVLTAVAEAEWKLFTRQASGFEWWVRSLIGDSSADILQAIAALPSMAGFDEGFGYHKDIVKEGVIHGGGIALWIAGVLYLEGASQAYGSMKREEVILALQSLMQVTGEFPYVLGEQLTDKCGE